MAGALTRWNGREMPRAVCQDTSLANDARWRYQIPLDHEVPEWYCHCGYYACKDADYLYTSQGVTPHDVIGIIELTGKVIEHEEGYRGEYATIRALWIPAPNVTPMSFTEGVYGSLDVPLFFRDKYGFIEEMKEWHRSASQNESS